MAEGFLGRWSRRKQEVREGKPVEAEPAVDVHAPGVPPPQPSPGGGGSKPPIPEGGSSPPPPAEGQGGGAPALEAAPPPSPPPTLEDAQQLTPQSDFTRFVARDVPPEVRNTALKKLFTDPHFNVMDGMDVYIDDYTKPDPMPESMLRGLASAQFLKLFREEDPEAARQAGTGASTEGSPAETVAQSDVPPPDPAPPEVPDADPDLRLQQDDAAEGGDPGRGAG